MRNHSPKLDASVSYKIAGFNLRCYRLHSAVSGAVLAKNVRLVEITINELVGAGESINPESFEAWMASGNDGCKAVLKNYEKLVHREEVA